METSKPVSKELIEIMDEIIKEAGEKNIPCAGAIPNPIGRTFVELAEMVKSDPTLLERLRIAHVTAGDMDKMFTKGSFDFDGPKGGIPTAEELVSKFNELSVEDFVNRIKSGEPFAPTTPEIDICAIAQRGTRKYTQLMEKEKMIDPKQEPEDIFGDVNLNIPTITEIDEQFQRELGEDWEELKAKNNGTIAICPTGHEPFCKRAPDDAKRGPFFKTLQKGYVPPKDHQFPHSMPHEVRMMVREEGVAGQSPDVIHAMSHEIKGVNLKSSRGMVNEFTHLDDPGYRPTKNIGRGMVNPKVESDHIDEEAWNPHDAVNQEDPEHTEWLRKRAIREEYETQPLMIDREQILELSEKVLGRFLGACRVQSTKTVSLEDLDRRTPLFDEEIDGVLVQITPSPVTRHMQVCIEKIGFINILLDDGWIYPGSYEEQLERFTNSMIKMHTEIQFEHIVSMTKLAIVLAKRDKDAMEKLIPPGITFRFKGNKGVFFSYGEHEVYYKDYSIHQHQDKIKLYKAVRAFFVSYLIANQIYSDTPVDYHKSRPYLGPFRGRDPFEPERG